MFRLPTRTIGADEGAVDYVITEGPSINGAWEVYRALQVGCDRTVAVYLRRPGFHGNPNQQLSEPLLVAQLQHVNTRPIYEIGKTSSGGLFYATKWLEGQGWSSAFTRLSRRENIEILVQVCKAISHAHSQNVIHRDLKPTSIWLGKQDKVYVLEWGLAARLDEESDIVPSGTPIYMPPETASAYLKAVEDRLAGGEELSVDSVETFGTEGKHCDIYLLGAMLYNVITGRAPHRGKNTFDCLKNAARNEIRATRKSGPLIAIAHRAMATNPLDRYRSVHELMDDLKSCLARPRDLRTPTQAVRETVSPGEENASDKVHVSEEIPKKSPKRLPWMWGKGE